MSVWSELAQCPEMWVITAYLVAFAGAILLGGMIVEEANRVEKTGSMVQGVDLEAGKPKTSDRRRKKGRGGAA